MSGFAQPILDSGGHLDAGMALIEKPFSGPGLLAKVAQILERAASDRRVPELLIVDDDEALRRWAERVVRDQGYSCEGAGDADAAREQLQHGAYQLALLDVNMPGESGMELLSHIRSRPSRRGGR